MIKIPKFLNILFYPVSLLFGMVVWLRNSLFDLKILKSREFDLPVISVGNITVGGTGKTPHVEYLLSLLAPEFKVAVLSRGYKRKTSGFFLASDTSTADEIGDEPCQIKHGFPNVIVATDANRVKGIEKILQLEPDVKAIILDDAFQHRYVTPGLSIVLVDYNRPISDDFLLPYGLLREMPAARSRADVIIVTKCPVDMKPIDQRLLEKYLKMYAYQKVFFTQMEYGEPQAVFPDKAKNVETTDLKKKSARLFTIAGIADSRPFSLYISNLGIVEKEIVYPDHHAYSVSDMHNLVEVFSASVANPKYIVTTAKDAMKLKQFVDLDDELKAAMYYIPMKVAFSDADGKNFNHYISSYVRNNRPDNILYQPKHPK